jgi:hypothetical protein
MATPARAQRLQLAELCQRLAAKFGPEISLRDLTARFSCDCPWRAEARSKRGQNACGVDLPDLEQPRPPGRSA